MEHALRVAAYCRVSTDKEDQLHSLAAQQAYFEGYIARHGWRCAGIFADEGLSGTTLRRPRFAELLRLARSGAVDLILIGQFDFGRQSGEDVVAVATAHISKSDDAKFYLIHKYLLLIQKFR